MEPIIWALPTMQAQRIWVYFDFRKNAFWPQKFGKSEFGRNLFRKNSKGQDFTFVIILTKIFSSPPNDLKEDLDMKFHFEM